MLDETSFNYCYFNLAELSKKNTTNVDGKNRLDEIFVR